MIRHAVQLAAATVLLVTCTVLAFLPGRFDRLAATVSAMAHLFGLSGIVLVPIGVLWLWHERRRRAGRGPGDRAERWLAALTVAAALLVLTALALLALVDVGPSLGIAVFGFGTYGAARLAATLKGMRTAPARPFTALPLYLVVLPAAAAISSQVLVPAASDFSRNRAIANSAPLIRDIEQYRVANGHYPPFLLSVHQDYHPGVMGVERYHYAPHGKAYNLYFEHLSFELGVREFVVYNPRDEQVMTSHAMDLLQLTPEQLLVEWTRGHNAVHRAPRPHWKYFWFD